MKNFVLISILIFLSSPALACDDGFEAFLTTVYKQVRQDCARCHDGTRPTAPPFAVSDAMASYNMLLNYMNFSKPEASLLVVRAGNGHCGTSACEEESGIEMAENAKTWWAQGENRCFRNGKYFTEEITLPANLPSPANGFMTLTFDLGQANPELKGTFVQLDVQDFQPASDSTPGAYRVKSPRFVGGRDAVRFKDIKVLLNGKYDPIYNAFTIEDKKTSFVATNLKAAAVATPILSGHSMIILKDTLTNPTMSISFVEVAPDQNTKCGAQDEFEKNVLPMMRTLNCATCHNQQGTVAGTQLLNMSRPINELCNISQELTNSSYPMSSAMISVPTRGLFGHPKISEKDNTAYVQVVKSWIQNAAKENR